MNLKFLQTINETTDTGMKPSEINTYLDLLYKKCSKSAKVEFNGYLKEHCGVEDADFAKCSEAICEGDTKDIMGHLEDFSNKLDENSLSMIIGKVEHDEENV